MVAPAEKLGRYTLVRSLGAGGMGELYLARADGIAGFAKLVALKRILGHKATNERHVRMLLHEARLVASLQHPNIAQVYDVGVEAGQYFFAMEYVHGQDLRHVLHRAPGRRLEPENGLHIAIGVCAGLHHAHEARDPSGASLGIVHRDVSPGNVLVSYDGAVKLVDFGVAKASTAVSETREGTVKGKYGYMSPEQCLGAPLDRRSDLFAVGILLWEMMLGRRLFKVQGELATLQRVVYVDAPRPSRYEPDFPPQLEQIIMRALARDPAHRYETAEQLQIDLQDFAVSHRLSVSSLAMSREMKDLFKERVDAWRDAERAGRSLADHLADLEDSDDPVDSDELDGVIGDLHTNVFTPDPLVAPPGALPASLAAAHTGVASPAPLPSLAGPPTRVAARPADGVPPLAPRRRGRVVAVLSLLLLLGIAAAAIAFFLGQAAKKSTVAHDDQPAPIVMEAVPPAPPTAVAADVAAAGSDVVVDPEDVAETAADVTETADVADARTNDTAEPLRSRDDHAKSHAPAHSKAKSEHASKPKPKAESKHESVTAAASPTEHAEVPTSEPAKPTSATIAKPASTVTAAGSASASAPVIKPALPAPGTVDANAVRAVVRAHLAEIQACVSRARMDDRDLTGRVAMRIELSATGAVTGTSVSSSTGATPSLESCMRKAVAGWTFPAPAGGVAAAIRYPFAF